jgi:hypothetical protein
MFVCFVLVSLAIKFIYLNQLVLLYFDCLRVKMIFSQLNLSYFHVGPTSVVGIKVAMQETLFRLHVATH